ncbi:MAG: carboxypeptidase regulatory-like domain-containing protein [Acidobacteriaceae bacterium]
MKRCITLFGGILFLVLPAFLAAQQTVTTASLAGRVLDPSGAVVAHATVSALQTSTNQPYSTTTDNQGRFRFPFLPVGQYRITTHETGFEEASQQVQLTVGAAFNLTLQFSLSQTTTSVHVKERPAVIETDSSQISETVNQSEVKNLPYEGRNYLDLSLLLPGVSPTNTASTQTLAETSEVVGQGYSVDSQRNISNSFVVDGLSANDDAAGVAGSVLSMDVVSEFQVVTSGGQAEFGRALGGYFNIITKSGANELHGAAYGFLRNQRLNANNALSGSKLPLTQGMYGASLGGPIRRNRTFFFGNFEEGRLNSNGVVTIIPTNAAQINAHLTATGYKAPLLPIGTGPTTIYATTLHTDTAFARVDHRFSQNDQFNIRYSLYKLSSINARGVGGLNAVSNGTSVYDTNHTIAASNIATLSPHMFNETRGQFIYDNLTAPPNDQMGPVVNISGVATFGRSTSSPTARQNYLYELVDNLVTERGAHTFKAGVDFLYNKDTITYPQSIRGSYTFSSLPNFLNDVYNTQGYTQNFGNPTVQQNNPNIGLYVQDEWQFSPAFTLNAGVRYDLQFLDALHTTKGNISPRIGFAWSPYASRRTVLRGSYGIFYDRIPSRALANALLSAHNTINPAQAALLSYTFSPGQTQAPVFPDVASEPPAGAVENYSLMNRNIRTPYSQQISLGLAQQLSANSTLGVSYQHVRGLHLIGSINTNINPDGTRPDPTRGNIKPYSSEFDSYYDGLQVSFRQRPVSWGSARISYTWSKAIDDIGEFFFSSPINNFDPGQDRSRSDDDQRQRVVFDAVVNSSMKLASGWAAHLTHDWLLGGILQYYSALPFNITTGTTTKQATSQRPCAPGYSLSANSGLNPCTEALRGAVIGRNAGIGFDFFNLNTRLSRTFSLTNRVKLEGIAEAFNVLNHRNDMIPNSTWGTRAYPSTPNPAFGQANAVGDPRSIQLATRITF